MYFVTSKDHRYLSNRIEREEGGTPDILGSIRAGLAFHIRSEVKSESLQHLEREMCDMILKRFDTMRNVVVVARHVTPRLPVISFLVRHGSMFLHQNFVSAVLNDVYGIQSRSGCLCAGPYAMEVLGIRGSFVRDLERELLEKNELLRPGFVRVSFPYFLRVDEVEYVLRAIEQVSKYAYRLLPLYRFNHKTGEILHRKRFTKFSQRLWLSDIGIEKKKIECKESYDELLRDAMSIYQSVTEKDLKQVPSHSIVLSENAERLRWFVWPDEITFDEKESVVSSCEMLRPELYVFFCVCVFRCQSYITFSYIAQILEETRTNQR